MSSNTIDFTFECEHGNTDAATTQKCNALRHQQSISKNDLVNRDRVLGGPGGNPVNEAFSNMKNKGIESLMAIGILVLLAMFMIRMKR